MELTQLLYLGKQFAKFFVYCCEGEQYVTLIDQFRWAKTRVTLVDSMVSLLQYSKPDPNFPVPKLSDENWKRLTNFILKEDIQDVRYLHTMMIRYISTFELEKIEKTEKYLTELLIHFNDGDHT